MKTKDILLELRTKKGLSQDELAEKVFVTRQAVSRWESGAAKPDADKIVAICDLFGVSADYLLGLTDEDPVYSQRRQKNNLNTENLATLKRFEAFLFFL